VLGLSSPEDILHSTHSSYLHRTATTGQCFDSTCQTTQRRRVVSSLQRETEPYLKRPHVRIAMGPLRMTRKMFRRLSVLCWSVRAAALTGRRTEGTSCKPATAELHCRTGLNKRGATRLPHASYHMAHQKLIASVSVWTTGPVT
jgi:hypothetical protein